jgi:hypothetical protein
MSEDFEEITVQRINIVDEDGKLRLALSNRSKFPEGTMDGRVLQPSGARGPGLVFFNDDGDECGGLIYAGDRESRTAYAQLVFDRLKQDQAIGIMYQEGDGGYGQGLHVWDRPATSLVDEADRMKQIEAIPDEEERQRALAKPRESGEIAASRFFAGRAGDGSSCILLMDSKGRPRIRIAVDASDNPVIEVLDAKGEVTWSMNPE